MYAVIETGGQQHRVAPGDTIRVARIAGSEATEIAIDKVLMVSRDEAVYIGKPYLENAAVKAEVQGEGKASKVIVYKKKPRKGYQKLRGHRQYYTVLKIKDIVFGG